MCIVQSNMSTTVAFHWFDIWSLFLNAVLTILQNASIRNMYCPFFPDDAVDGR